MEEDEATSSAVYKWVLEGKTENGDVSLKSPFLNSKAELLSYIDSNHYELYELILPKEKLFISQYNDEEVSIISYPFCNNNFGITQFINWSDESFLFIRDNVDKCISCMNYYISRIYTGWKSNIDTSLLSIMRPTYRFDIIYSIDDVHNIVCSLFLDTDVIKIQHSISSEVDFTPLPIPPLFVDYSDFISTGNKSTFDKIKKYIEPVPSYYKITCHSKEFDEYNILFYTLEKAIEFYKENKSKLTNCYDVVSMYEVYPYNGEIYETEYNIII